MRMLFCVWLILFTGSSFAEAVTVSGTVIDQRTNTALPGARVDLYELVGAWKFWKLPENKLVDSAVSDEHGAFELSGDVSTFYVIELRLSGCWIPFRETFKIGEGGNMVDGLIISTEPFYCNE